MSKIFKLVITLMLVITMACGCSLATTDSAAGKGNLCGVLITHRSREESGISNEDMGKIVQGGQSGVMIDSDQVMNGISNIIEGVVSENKRIMFPGVTGFEFVNVPSTVTNEKGTYDVEETYSSPAFFDINTTINFSDEGQSKIIKSSCYIPNKTSEIFLCNPVYRRDDGTYYTELNNMGGMGIYDSKVGERYGRTVSENQTMTSGGKTKNEGVTIEMNFVVASGTKSAAIKEFNRENVLIKTSPLNIVEKKSSYTLQKDTAYIIIEEIPEDEKEEPKLTIYDYKKNSETPPTHKFYSEGTGGIMEAKTIEFVKQ